jgi:hypothetical protein
MIRDFRFGLVFGLALGLAGLVAAQTQAQEPLPPLPDRNPARSGQPATDTALLPAPEEKPNLPGDKPTVAWTDPKVVAAREACAEMLAGVTLDYEQLNPIKKGLCGAPAPILVKSIGDPAVTISPPATMRCTLAVALDAWLRETVQPAASVLGSRVVTLRNASSYKCRNRYGGANTKISEHALANALDISEFVFASGQRFKVWGNWPYGAVTRPIAPEPPLPNPHRVADAAIERAMASEETTGAIVAVSTRPSFGNALAAVTKVKTNPFVRPTPPPVARPPLSPLPRIPSGSDRKARTPIAAAKSNPFVSPLPAPGASLPAEEPEVEKVTSEPSPPRKLQPEDAAAFMRVVHNDACKTFETVLGPAANAAHKDHFHFDMKKRRYVKICE